MNQSEIFVDGAIFFFTTVQHFIRTCELALAENRISNLITGALSFFASPFANIGVIFL